MSARFYRYLPLLTGLMPIVAIHLTYVVAATEGFVPWCNPYIDSCTSISATGRHGTAWWIFKAAMLPYAVLLVVFWRYAGDELARIGDTGRTPMMIRRMGTIAAIFLVVYTVALGAAGEYFQLQRRIGIVLYFSMTAFAELLYTWRLGKLEVPDRTRPFHLSICVSFLVIGLFSLYLDATLGDGYDDLEDAFEWVLALIMQCYFLVMFFTWKQPAFQVYSTGPNTRASTRD